MAECSISLLETSLSPEKIRLVLELVPPEGSLFDMKLEDPGKKISMVANYAMVTFEAKPNPPVSAPSDPAADEERAKRMEERRKKTQERISERDGRLIDMLERELDGAEKSGDPAAIQRAKDNLAKAKARIEAQKNGA